MSTVIAFPDGFRTRRFLNWFPLGFTYALLYMGRYNLTVAQGALKDLIDKADFGDIFGVGAAVYGVAFFLNGPLTDRLGGKKAILAAAGGAALANLAMGFYTQQVLTGAASPDGLKGVFTLLYAVNMYFQSFGAVAIVKVNASWFHVRERGKFSGIFGIMIASGIFLAFDVGAWILDAVQYTRDPGGVDPKWLVFWIPAIALATMFVVELFLLRDRPSQAGFSDFDTADASSGESDKPLPTLQLMKRILTNRVILIIAGVEFCTGVLRQGVMHWYRIYAGEQVDHGLTDYQFGLDNWGLILFIAGIIGGNVAGWVSDLVFQSRRAPAAFGLYSLLAVTVVGMWLYFQFFDANVLVGLVFMVSLCVIGTHGLLSGTATMDFGGRRGAATAVGIIDGAVYIGTAVQSVVLGRITSSDWSLWPVFLFPFALVGCAFLSRIWHAKPGKSGGH